MKKLLCVVLLGVVGVAGAQSQAPNLPNPVVMTVNGEEVHLATISMAMSNIARQLASQGESPEQDQMLHAATSQAVDITLLAQEARRRGVTLEDSEVDAALAEIEAKTGGRQTLASELEEVGMSTDLLRRDLVTSLHIQRLVEQHIMPGITVADVEVAEFYSANQEAFQGPEEVRARHILRVVDQQAGDDVRAAAQWAAAEARERALAGEDFAELAREFSQGPSAPRGGDLGFFSLEDMVEPFVSTAFALEPGEISEVVETRFGYHVIKLEERRAAGLRPLEEIREQLRAALVERRVGEAMAALLEDLRSKAEIIPAEEIMKASAAAEAARE